MTSLINLFLKTVKDYTDGGMPLHRAKALKWTGEGFVGSAKNLSKYDKDSLWQKVLERDFVKQDERGNILGLTKVGEDFLLNFESRNKVQ
jgi:hypothetical protein